MPVATTIAKADMCNYVALERMRDVADAGTAKITKRMEHSMQQAKPANTRYQIKHRVGTHSPRTKNRIDVQRKGHSLQASVA